MLYKYNGKIYVKPFPNKIVEVKISKKGNDFNIEPTSSVLYLNDVIKKEMVSVTNEEALKTHVNKEQSIGNL